MAKLLTYCRKLLSYIKDYQVLIGMIVIAIAIIIAGGIISAAMGKLGSTLFAGFRVVGHV